MKNNTIEDTCITWHSNTRKRSLGIEILHNNIHDDTIGIECVNDASPQIHFNEIYNNTNYAVHNSDDDYWINAEYNWWGDSTGPRDTSRLDTLHNPNGLGDWVSNHVDYDPWIGGSTPVLEDMDTPYNVVNTVFNAPTPNPFYQSLYFTYDIKQAQYVTINIYNSLGQVVRTLVNDKKNAGRHKVFWNGKDTFNRQLPAGVYLCRFKCEEYNHTEKIVKIN